MPPIGSEIKSSAAVVTGDEGVMLSSAISWFVASPSAAEMLG